MSNTKVQEDSQQLNFGRSLLSLSWQSAAYGLGIMGRQVLVYLTLPLFTRIMSQAEYGVVIVLLSSLGFINTLTNAGIPAALFRLYGGAENEDRRQHVIGSSLLLFFLLAFLPALLLAVSAQSVSRLLFGSETYVALGYLVAGIIVVETMIYFGTLLLRLQQRPMAVSGHSIVLTVAQIGLGLYLVWHGGSAFDYFLGQLLGGLVGLMLMGWLTWDILSWRPSRYATKELLAFGLPLLPVTLATWTIRSADRVLVGMIAGVEQAAIYGIGYKIGMLVAFATIPFTTAWPPFAFSIMKREGAPLIYRNMLTVIATLYLYLALGVTAFRAELVSVLAPEAYATAGQVIAWVAAGQALWGLYPILSLGPKIAKRTGDLVYVTVGAAVFNVLLNILLIPRWGIWGAGVATFAAYLMLAVVTYWVGQRSFKILLDWTRLGKLAVAYLLTLGALALLGPNIMQVGQHLLVRLACVFVYPLSLVLLRFVDWTDLQKFFRLGSWLVQQRFKMAAEYE